MDSIPHIDWKKSFAEARRFEDLGAFWALDLSLEETESRSPAPRDDDGSSSSLAGIGFGVKDLFDQAGLPTTAGLPGNAHPAASDAEAVRRLRAAGAVPIGKTAMDQLACTTGAYAPGFPPCINPIDAGLSPGGSSSGSAAAVAAGIVPFALGTDTAGSCRVPAAYCGVVGFKPASGRISARGCVPVMPGFDQPGLLARSVADCVAAYRVLAAQPRTGLVDSRPPVLKLGLLEDLFADSDSAVEGICREHLSKAGERGGNGGAPRIELCATRLEWPAPGLGVALARSLARTWGERVERDPERFNEVIRSTVEFGRSIGDPAEQRALTGFSLARRRFRRRFMDYDAIVSPTVPIACPDREEETVSVSTAFTRNYNALGWPAISIPAGTDQEGRPVGLQIAAPPSRLGSLFSVAAALE